MTSIINRAFAFSCCHHSAPEALAAKIVVVRPFFVAITPHTVHALTEIDAGGKLLAILAAADTFPLVHTLHLSGVPKTNGTAAVAANAPLAAAVGYMRRCPYLRNVSLGAFDITAMDEFSQPREPASRVAEARQQFSDLVSLLCSYPLLQSVTLRGALVVQPREATGAADVDHGAAARARAGNRSSSSSSSSSSASSSSGSDAGSGSDADNDERQAARRWARAQQMSEAAAAITLLKRATAAEVRLAMALLEQLPSARARLSLLECMSERCADPTYDPAHVPQHKRVLKRLLGAKLLPRAVATMWSLINKNRAPYSLACASPTDKELLLVENANKASGGSSGGSGSDDDVRGQRRRPLFSDKQLGDAARSSALVLMLRATGRLLRFEGITALRLLYDGDIDPAAIAAAVAPLSPIELQNLHPLPGRLLRSHAGDLLVEICHALIVIDDCVDSAVINEGVLTATLQALADAGEHSSPICTTMCSLRFGNSNSTPEVVLFLIDELAADDDDDDEPDAPPPPQQQPPPLSASGGSFEVAATSSASSSFSPTTKKRGRESRARSREIQARRQLIFSALTALGNLSMADDAPYLRRIGLLERIITVLKSSFFYKGALQMLDASDEAAVAPTLSGNSTTTAAAFAHDVDAHTCVAPPDYEPDAMTNQLRRELFWSAGNIISTANGDDDPSQRELAVRSGLFRICLCAINPRIPPFHDVQSRCEALCVLHAVFPTRRADTPYPIEAFVANYGVEACVSVWRTDAGVALSDGQRGEEITDDGEDEKASRAKLPTFLDVYERGAAAALSDRDRGDLGTLEMEAKARTLLRDPELSLSQPRKPANYPKVWSRGYAVSVKWHMSMLRALLSRERNAFQQRAQSQSNEAGIVSTVVRRLIAQNDLATLMEAIVRRHRHLAYDCHWLVREICETLQLEIGAM